MRITELYGHRNADTLRGKEMVSTGERQPALRAFTEFLEQKGFHIISKQGSFCVVFGRADLNYAIKVFRNDPAYLTFVKFCLGQKNPHLPMFRGALVKVQGAAFAVRMELLKPLTTINWEVILYIVDAFLERDKSVNSPQAFIEVEGPKYAKSVMSNEWALIQSQPGFLETLAQVQKLCHSHGFDMDLSRNPGNIMLRGKTLVITDPIYHPDSLLT
jgi:hypothetical protein